MNRVIVTGGLGFIGSNVVLALNQRGITPFIIDNWKDNDPKWRNINGLRFVRLTYDNLGYGDFWKGLVVIALGASVDTKEGMSEKLWENNINSITRLHEWCKWHNGKFVYASSGSVYGNEEKDFTERLDFRPRCPYAATKLHVDQMLFGDKPAPRTYGLRFFNVFGPREAHKGEMASLVTKGLLKLSPLYQSEGLYQTNGNGGAPLKEIKEHWSLFKSPVDEPIMRDFIYVQDVADIICHFMDKDDIPEGLYNLGTGIARSFESLVKAVDPSLPIEHTPIPAALANQYQRYTCANITKLRELAKYDKPFTTLEEGIEKTRTWMKEEGLIA
jgi:ADP-L-glycero-D-manno-heptose 6-epimerase